ncbi:hypothetical protein V6N11_053883 [Hibiscus sabdariffa]|uniref:Uncharacterized protein n=1 Tax=Hibiscus sabdariffa TaxID=183260 RepID=A0ABR2S341_9ROSI
MEENNCEEEVKKEHKLTENENLPVKTLAASLVCPRCLLEPESAIHAGPRLLHSGTNPTKSHGHQHMTASVSENGASAGICC